MKYYTRLLLISVALAGFGTACLTQLTGCSTPPNQRVAQVQTLKAVGLSAKTAMDAATDLFVAGKITHAQWDKVAVVYDAKFQPAFRIAVAAVGSDMSSIASPDLIGLALEINTLVTNLKSR